MAADRARLLALAEAVADGRAIEWQDAESSAPDDQRHLVSQLRLLASVADTHRARETGPPESTSSDAATPESWGAFEIRERVGAGSFGTVYRAWDPRLAREVALKLLHREHPGAELGSRVVEEGRLLARVDHRHVITVYGADRIDGRVGIWMEFLHGKTLEETVRMNGPLSAREAALIGIDVCGALAAVHRQGLVHGDVKGQNVMREDGGRIVLMDFGAGTDRHSAGGGRTGTPVYMPPEGLAGAPSSTGSDIYAVGVLLFYLVTGEYPVAGRTAADVRAAHARGDRRSLRDVRPDTPSWFIRIVECALAVDPVKRFQTAGALESALAEALVGLEDDRARDGRVDWRWVAPALGIVALVAAGAGFLSWRNATTVPRADHPATAVKSIAILPFVNQTGDPAQDYFAAGLTDVLGANLGSVGALRVVPVRPAALAGGEAARAALLTNLNVDASLETSVQRSGDRVSFAARLVHAGTGAIVWSRSYEGAGNEAFTLQARIAADIAREVGASPMEPARAAARPQYAPTVQVQDAYLRGRYLLDTINRANMLAARAELERAVSLDPGYAPARAALATTYLALGNLGLLEPAAVRPLADGAATAAFNTDPTLAEAALAIADVRFRLDWNWAAADQAYRNAISLNPNYVQARSQYARYLAAAGRTQEAVDEARRASVIDPLSEDAHNTVGLMLYYQRRYDDAIAHYETRPGGPTLRGHVGRARAYAEKGRFADAIAELEFAVERSGDNPGTSSLLAVALVKSGDPARGRAILDRLRARRGSGGEYVAPQDLAYIHTALGEHDEAFRLFNEAVDEHASRLLWLAVDPRLDALRSDPRLPVLLRRLGLPG